MAKAKVPQSTKGSKGQQNTAADTLEKVAILAEQMSDLSDFLLDLRQRDTDGTLTLLNVLHDKAKEIESIVEAEILKPSARGRR